MVDTHCFVCHTGIQPANHHSVDQYTTRHTNRSVFELLEDFLGYSLREERSDANRWCDACLQRINEYDLAMQTANRCEAELIELFMNALKAHAVTIDDIEADGDDGSQTTAVTTMIELLDANELEDEEPPTVESSFQHAREKCNRLKVEVDEFSEEQLYELEMASMNRPLGDDDDDEDEDQQSLSAVYLIDECSEDASPSVAVNQPIADAEELRRPLAIVRDDGDIRHPHIMFKCTRCSQDFETNSAYKVHIKACKTSRKPIVCQLCNHMWPTRAALKIHMAQHNGISPFECDVCGKQFPNRCALVRHMPLHTGEKPYQV